MCVSHNVHVSTISSFVIFLGNSWFAGLSLLYSILWEQTLLNKMITLWCFRLQIYLYGSFLKLFSATTLNRNTKRIFSRIVLAVRYHEYQSSSTKSDYKTLPYKTLNCNLTDTKGFPSNRSTFWHPKSHNITY